DDGRCRGDHRGARGSALGFDHCSPGSGRHVLHDAERATDGDSYGGRHSQPDGEPERDSRPAAAPTSLAGVGHGECSIQNLTGAMTSLEQLKPVLRLVGFKAGWMSIMAPAPSDNPNPEPGDWFWIAKLVNGSYVQETSLGNWAGAASNNDRLTAEQFMDKAFVTNGLPVELRPDLVGSPEPGSLAAEGL